MNIEQLGWDAATSEAFEPHRSQGMIPARVAREDRQRYLLFTQAGELAAELTGRLRYGAASRADLPAVGDWVAAIPCEGDFGALIHAVLPRRTVISRDAAGRSTEQQVIAANVDTIFLVNGLDRDFNLRRLERYLTAVWETGARPVVVLNKADLCEALDERLRQVEKVASGVPVHPLSALQGTGLEPLAEYQAPGATVALMGSSGVGKSTLINCLVGDDRQLVHDLRHRDGRGMHTTTARELIPLPGGGVLVDTPGMRELRLWGDADDALGGTFEDVEELAAGCHFRDCGHHNEPGCAVLAAIERGDLEAKRLANYHKLQRELRFIEARRGTKERLAQKARSKSLSRTVRRMQKEDAAWRRKHL